MHRLVVAAIAVRVVAALVLVAGPWTDDGAELEGWDVARFQEIADAEGRAWVDHPVEYPPGSVVAIEAVAVGGVVATHRILVVLSLAADLGTAALVASLGGRAAAGRYLLLGLPLVPMGLVRFDVWAILAAVAAVVALIRRRPAAFAVAVTVAALVKVWPALVVSAAVALGRWRAVGWTVVVAAGAGLAWLAYGGGTLDPVDQVLSLRGATGWHVESIGGTVTALVTDDQPERQLDAFRIGTLDDGAVLAGRALTVAAVAALILLARRALASASPGSAANGGPGAVAVVALLLLGSTAALLATAPLLSPQFLLWLTPWAALVPLRSGRWPAPVALTALGAVITGVVLTLYGPPRLAETVPALVLTVRNLVLVAIVVTAAVELHRRSRSSLPEPACALATAQVRAGAPTRSPAPGPEA